MVVDLRWRENGTGRGAHVAAHVPGARFCDWTSDMVDPTIGTRSCSRHRSGSAALMRRLGIADDTTVVAYADQAGSGPFRLWWACRVYGHDQVRILNGGFERWLREERPVEAGDVAEGAPGPAADVGWSVRPPLEPPVATADDVEAAGTGAALLLRFETAVPVPWRGGVVRNGIEFLPMRAGSR